MAMAGCRAAPSTLFARPSTFRSFLPCRAMADPSPRNLQASVSSSSGSCSDFTHSSLSQHVWRRGCSKGFFGRIVRLGGEGDGLQSTGKALRSSQQQRLFVKAINVSGPGSVDSPLMQSMQTKIKEDLDAESVTVKDAYGDGRHVSIDVVASVFEGKSAVNRQRLVYKAIWQELQETVHAVDQLKTRTPSEAANSPGQL